MKISLLTIVFLLLGIQISQAQEPEEAHKRKWKFLIAHLPSSQENKAQIDQFRDRVAAATKGNLDIEPLPLLKNETEESLRAHAIAISDVFVGRVEMSQVAIDRLFKYCPELDALDAPLVFRNHEHAAKVLDGPIGKQLKKCVLEGSNGKIRGLYFTYSGGLRSFYATKPISHVSDLRGLRLVERGARMASDMADFLGFKIVKSPDLVSDFMKSHASGEVEAEESELIRMARWRAKYPRDMENAKYVFESNHSLYLTLIVVNGPAFDSLDKAQQALVDREAKTLAEQERVLSIRQGEEAKKSMMEAGVTFAEPSPEDRAALQELAARVYKKHDKELGSLIRAIKKVK